MSDERRVGLKEFRNQLSRYLRLVREGVRVLVTDHGEVIAEIRRPVAKGSSLLEEWERTGIVIRPTRRRRRLPRSPVRSPEGTAARILDELRGE
jgi:antitoxin (DNA-binding transcriptional repressor) of toxin-antitoxin stability system